MAHQSEIEKGSCLSPENISLRALVRDNSVSEPNFTSQKRRSNAHQLSIRGMFMTLLFFLSRSKSCIFFLRRMQYSLTFTCLPSVREFYGLISGECKVIILPLVPIEQPGPLIACALEDVKRQLQDEIFILYPEERERVLSNAILQVGHQGRKPDLSPFRWVCDDNNNCFVNIEEADFSEPFFCSYFTHSL